jgi:hypothetical protein
MGDLFAAARSATAEAKAEAKTGFCSSSLPDLIRQSMRRRG